METIQIYKNYKIPQNLQEHMLRVAALAEIFLEYWRGQKVNKKAIIQACLFHDSAKPMTFHLVKQAQFGMQPDEIKKLAVLQNELKTKYGNDEHKATVKICEEIGLSPTVVKLVNDLEWNYIPRLLKNNEIESLIPIYCDMRIGPKGIMTLSERLNELKKRVNTEDFKDNVKNGNALEQTIKNNVKIDVNEITNDQINKRFENLLNKEI